MRTNKLIMKNFSTNDLIDLTSRLLKSSIRNDGEFKILTLTFAGNDISDMARDHISHQVSTEVRKSTIQRMKDFNAHVSELKEKSDQTNSSELTITDRENAISTAIPELIPDDVIAKQEYIYDLCVEYDIIDDLNQHEHWDLQHGFITMTKREHDKNNNLLKIEIDIKFETAISLLQNI